MSIVDPHWPRASVWLASEHDDPSLLVVGVLSSRASLSPSRADLTPLVVRDRLSRFSTFHGEMNIDFGDLPVRDMGNWPVSNLDMHEMPVAVARLARDLPPADLKLYLGGDNAITRPLVVAESENLGRVGVITFDAHHDVRSLEGGPTNGTPIRGLIEEHGLPGQNVVQIGIHSFANSAAYRRYSDEAGITVVTVDQVNRIGMTAAVDVALSQMSHTCDRIYVDVDLDVLDRIFAPGCPGSRPGGLTVRQLAEGVARCAAHPKVTAIDFVEVDSEADPHFITVDNTVHVILSAVVGFATR